MPTSASDLTTGVLAVANGGTGGSTPAAAATNLGLGTGNAPKFMGVALTGTSNVTGTILVAPRGDLPMGPFTSGPTPTIP
jgi:hypothetical protein